MIGDLIKLILEGAEEERLIKWALKGGTPGEVRLAKLGIAPLPHGDRSAAFLGKGAYNDVFEVLWNGHRAAARISGSKEELSSMLRFTQLMNKMDPKYSVHFPVIYQLIDDNKSHTYGVIMELLQPVEANLHADIGSSGFGKVQNRKKHVLVQVENPESRLIKKIISDCSNETFKNPTIFSQEIRNLYKNIVIPIIKDSAKKNIHNRNLWDLLSEKQFDFANGLMQVLKAADYKNPMLASRHFTNMFFTSLRSSLNYQLFSSEAVSTSPGEGERVMSHPSKQLRKFYDFLQALKKYGVTYRDLHEDNIMQRPKTGDIVIVDPGLFRFQ